MSDKPNDAVKEAKGIINAEAIAALERVRSNICDHGARFIDQGFGIGCWVVPKSAVINEIDRELAQLRGGKEAK